MQYLVTFIFMYSLLCSVSCKTPQTQPNPEPNQPETSLTGTFENKRGVMDPLSCFCFNCGYVTTTKGERVAVCITEESFAIHCKKVLIKGKYVTVKKESDPNGVCSGGTMTYFEASSVTCY